jgi:N-acetyl-D-muramate 6-phosphate phosphatase
MRSNGIDAVLFDLDGTVADTAPDLVGALNRLRAEEGFPPLPVSSLRTFASQGARGLLREGLGIKQNHPEYPQWVERFLMHYEKHLCVETVLFEGIPELLDALEQRQIAWGIVTNKYRRFTAPLVDALNLASRVSCVICGDSTAHPKPAPDPLLHACNLIHIAPSQCLYVGDDPRDIQAGLAAQTRTLAAAWGYLGTDVGIHDWGADGIISRPLEILDWLPSSSQGA